MCLFMQSWGASFPMRAILDAISEDGYAGRESDAYQEYLPSPAHRKRAAITAPSGAALISVCGGLIHDMVQRGHRVLAFAPGLSSKDLRFLAQMGVEPYSLPTQLAFLDKYRRMRELSTILADAAPDVVLVQSARNGATSVAAAKIARIPKVVTVVPELGPAFMEAAGASAWGERQAMKAMYRAVFAWSDAVIFHSPHDRDYVRERNLLSKSKTHFIVGGWGEDLRRNMQRELPPLDRGLLFIMAAPLDRLQGVLEYCEAARAMRQKSRRARFFLASTPGGAVSPLSAADLKPYREFVQYIGPIADFGFRDCALPCGCSAVLRQRGAALSVPGLGGWAAGHRHRYAKLPRFRAAGFERLSRGGSRPRLHRAGHDANSAAAGPSALDGAGKPAPRLAILRCEQREHAVARNPRALERRPKRHTGVPPWQRTKTINYYLKRPRHARPW